MKLEQIYKMAKLINETVGDKEITDVIIHLNEAKHENLQQEVYRLSNKTLQGYESKSKFDIVLYNTKFTFKMS